MSAPLEQRFAAAAVQPDAPVWRREPYRLFFPLGWLLAFWGTGPWLLFALGVDGHYRSIFHAMAQVQGFLTCYAVGFLLTFIPRRTGTAPPPGWLIVVAALCPVATTGLAFAERWAASQAPWMLLLLLLVGFSVRRATRRRAARPVPASFVWIPASLLLAVVGTVVTGVAAAIGPEWMWLHDAARGAVLQGAFTGLMFGIGSFLLPMLAYGELAPDPPADVLRRRSLWHALAALVFFGSFALEGIGLVVTAHALRAATGFAVFVLGGRLHRWPTAPGTHRKLAWAGAWCIPLGYALVAALPGYRQLGLHVVFIGGFALSAFAVSTHVALSHGGAAHLLQGPSRATRLMALLLVLAALSRALVLLDPPRYHLWLGLAAAAFLGAAGVWASRVASHLLPRARA